MNGHRVYILAYLISPMQGGLGFVVAAKRLCLV
jgi:hypothetical protein